jgi:hypothetical protein
LSNIPPGSLGTIATRATAVSVAARHDSRPFGRKVEAQGDQWR